MPAFQPGSFDRLDWNAELLRGDLNTAVLQLKHEPGKGLLTGGVTLPRRWRGWGLMDECEFVVHPRIVGHGPTSFAGLSKSIDLKLVAGWRTTPRRWRRGMSR